MSSTEQSLQKHQTLGVYQVTAKSFWKSLLLQCKKAFERLFLNSKKLLEKLCITDVVSHLN